MSSNSDACGTLATAMPPSAGLLPSYRPFTSLFGLGLFAGGCFGALYFTHPAAGDIIGKFFISLDKFFGAAGPDNKAGFFGRIPENTYIELMVALLLLVFIYSLLQLYGAKRDYRWFAFQLQPPSGQNKPVRTFNFLFCLLTGRETSLYADDQPSEFYLRQLAMHRRFGMMALSMPMRFFLWAFPMIGFLGTAIGLSRAIRGLPLALKTGKMDDVLVSLAFKFDTTILGIVSALFVMLLIQFYERLWEDLEILEDGAKAARAAKISCKNPRALERLHMRRTLPAHRE